MLGRIEVGFADLHMHDAPALRFELARAREHFEGVLGAEPFDGGGDADLRELRAL